MAKTDTDLALAAISADLDQQTQLLAEQAGAHSALVELVGDTRATLGRIESKLDDVYRRVGQVLDRLDEVDELRGRVARVAADLERVKAS